MTPKAVSDKICVSSDHKVEVDSMAIFGSLNSF